MALINKQKVQDFKRAAIVMGVGLLFMAQTAFSQNKPVDESVLNVIKNEQAVKDAQTRYNQYKADRDYIDQNRALVNKLSAEEQSYFKNLFVKGQHNTDNAVLAASELANHLRDNHDKIKNSKNKPDQHLSLAINTYGKNASRKLFNEVGDAKATYTVTAKELDDVQQKKLQALLDGGKSPDDIIKENEQLRKQAELAQALTPEIQNWSAVMDELYNAQYMDHLPPAYAQDKLNDLTQITPKNSEKQLGNLVGIIGGAGNLSDELTQRPITNLELRKHAIGTVAVYLEELEALKQGKQLTETEKDNVYNKYVADSYDYDVEVIKQFREELQAEKAFVDTTSDYRALAVYLSPETVDQMVQLEQSIDDLNEAIEQETDDQLKESLTQKRSDLQNAFDKNDKAIEKKVEKNRKKIVGHISNLYTAAVIEQGLYEQAKAGKQVDSQTMAEFTQNKSHIQSGNSSLSQQDWQNYNTSKMVYMATAANNDNNNNIIENTHKRSYDRSHYNKGLTAYGTYSNSSYRTGYNKSSYTHNGHTGSRSHSRGYAGISTHAYGGRGEKTYNVRVGASYSIQTRGSGLPGLRDFLLKW